MFETLTGKQAQLAAHKPFPAEIEADWEKWFAVELTYNSNAIEGNTLTRMETAEILEKGLEAVVKKELREQCEAFNHGKAMEFIRGLAVMKTSHQFLSETDIKNIHAKILQTINDNWAGKYRQILVSVGGSNVEFPAPREVPLLMKQFLDWLTTVQDQHPVQVAAEAHLRLVTIHPFVDGNGRTARLLMNLILLIHGYPITVVRNEDRVAYLESIQNAQLHGDSANFIQLMAQAVDRSLDRCLRYF